MDSATQSGESASDISAIVENQSAMRKTRTYALRGWTAVSVLVGLSVAGYLGAFVVFDTYLKGSFF